MPGHLLNVKYRFMIYAIGHVAAHQRAFGMQSKRTQPEMASSPFQMQMRRVQHLLSANRIMAYDSALIYKNQRVMRLIREIKSK